MDTKKALENARCLQCKKKAEDLEGQKVILHTKLCIECNKEDDAEDDWGAKE